MKTIPALYAAGMLAAAAIMPAAMAADMPNVKLQVVGNLGITTQYHELEAPFWNEVVPKASNNAITATIKPWNEMGLKGPEVYKLLRQGVFDVGTTQMGFMAGDAPINDATDLAGVSPDIDTFLKVTQVFRPTIEQYYEKQQGIKVLGLWSYQGQVLYCRNELKGLADLKGRKVRVSGASQADFIGYFGGSGINMAFGEVQHGLQSGVIDCAITGTLGGYKAKWHEGAKYLYPLPINWGSSISSMNLKRWNSLAPAAKELLTAEYKKLEQAIYEQNVREHDLGLACNTGQGECTEGEPASMVLGTVSEEDLALRRQALLEHVLPRWAQRCGADCAQNWNDTIGKVVDLTAKAP